MRKIAKGTSLLTSLGIILNREKFPYTGGFPPLGLKEKWHKHHLASSPSTLGEEDRKAKETLNSKGEKPIHG